jgi:glutathione S-transferase
MLKLCGFPASNYHNKAKLVLLEKAVVFEEKLVYPSQEPGHLENSPMGKLPYLETPNGKLRESQVIVEYIEDVYPERPLYPRDAFARARCRELIHFMELYLELPARRLYPAAFFGGSASDELKKEVTAQLDKGVRAFGRLVHFEPYILGTEFSVADIAAAVHFPLIVGASKMLLGRDVLEPIANLKVHLKMLSERPHFQAVNAARKADTDRMLASAKRKE